MKLGILTALWHRPKLTEFFLDRLETLKNKLDVVPVAVGSEGMFKDDCERRGIIYRDHINKPLGLKWNHGIRAFKDLDVTHVMIMGSDDFMSDDFVEFSMAFAEDKDFSGCKDVFMFGAHPNRRGWRTLFYFRYKGFLVGPGRVYSKRIIELMDWTPWNVNRNYGLDGSITKSVNRLGGQVKRGSFVMRDEELFMVDIKTPGNISGIPGAAKPFDLYGIEVMLHDHLPKGEADNLCDYLTEISSV